jgi:hypothetical protein
MSPYTSSQVFPRSLTFSNCVAELSSVAGPLLNARPPTGVLVSAECVECNEPFAALFGVRGGVESVMGLSNSPARTADRQIRALIRPIERDSEGSDLFRSAAGLQNRNLHSACRLSSPLMLASSSGLALVRRPFQSRQIRSMALLEKEPLASKYSSFCKAAQPRVPRATR